MMDIVIGLTLGIGATLTLRVVFNLNDYLERRERRLREKLQRTCPHFIVEVTEGSDGHRVLLVKSSFSTYPGTFNCICSRCGCITQNKYLIEESYKRWVAKLNSSSKSVFDAYEKQDRLRKKLDFF